MPDSEWKQPQTVIAQRTIYPSVPLRSSWDSLLFVLPLKIVFALSKLIDNPYTPPTNRDSSTLLHHGPTDRVYPRSVLLVLSAAISVIAWFSVSSNVPAYYSPFPLLVILPVFFDCPVSLVSAGAGCAFALTQLAHFRAAPKKSLNVGFTIALVLTTLLTTVSIVAGWSYGIEYQGLRYCVVVTIANALFTFANWGLWWVAQTAGRSRAQVVFAFTLFAWMFWYALPYMGEI